MPIIILLLNKKLNIIIFNLIYLIKFEKIKLFLFTIFFNLFIYLFIYLFYIHNFSFEVNLIKIFPKTFMICIHVMRINFV